MNLAPERVISQTTPERLDRERAVGAYAEEIRTFQAFFAIVLVGLATYHLLILLPILQVGSSIPVAAAALAEAERQAKIAGEPQRAATATLQGIEQFRRELNSAHSRLSTIVSDVVWQGRELVGRRGNPFKALVRVPKQTANQTGASQLEYVPVDEVIRRQIGKHTDALNLSLEAALEPLRTLEDPPRELQTAFLAANDSLVREVVGLNQVLRDAFAADPYFWTRWRQGGGLGAASPQTAAAVRRIEDGLNSLSTTLTATSIAWKGRQEKHQDALGALRARDSDLRGRWAGFSGQFAHVPLGLHGALRLYPIVAAALALTLLVRVRRILTLRRMHAGLDLDTLAPSWVVGMPSLAARMWAFVLVAAPLAAAIHGAAAASTDRGLFVNALGDYNPTMLIGYTAAYAVLILFGLVHLVSVTRGVLTAPRKRPAPAPSGDAGAVA